jgi:hypothetical protein
VAEYQKAIQIISNKINARTKDQFLFLVLAIVSLMLMSASLVFFSGTFLCVWYSAVHLKNEKKSFESIKNSMEYIVKLALLKSGANALLLTDANIKPHFFTEVEA